jgi:hypothetical protein
MNKMKNNKRKWKVVIVLAVIILGMGFAYAAVPAYKSWLSDGVNLFTFEKVGIGTAEPSASLDIVGDIAVNGSVVINESGDWIGSSVGLVGSAGLNGTDGLHCWDVNENQICDPVEDRNSDAFCNILDCRGDKGDKGDKGDPGPAVTTSAVCVNTMQNCGCSIRTISAVPGPCTVTSDTGSCSSNVGGAVRCCVCSA